MSEMVERVARALDRYAFEEPPTIDDPGANALVICKDENERSTRQFNARMRAKTAISAMREPTESMQAAGYPDKGDMWDTEEIWQHMIDEALR